MGLEVSTYLGHRLREQSPAQRSAHGSGETQHGGPSCHSQAVTKTSARGLSRQVHEQACEGLEEIRGEACEKLSIGSNVTLLSNAAYKLVT